MRWARSLPSGNRWRGPLLASAAIVGAVLLSLLNHWEMTPEAWGYWFFARVFAETGKFIVPDRSPLYTLYLNGFRWLEYPTSVTVEYVVTSVFSVISLVALFKPYLGWRRGVLAAILWIPFLQQVAEPPVQRIALALQCWAVVARRTTRERFRVAVSYALLGLSVMFRATSIVVLALFVVWDILRTLKRRGLGTSLALLRPRRADWPMGAVLVLFVWMAAMQSAHPWNNVWVATTAWFPSQGKTLAHAAFIQNFNVAYIARTYGSFEGKDFYFTNRELFGNASSVLGDIRANPRFVVGQIVRNVRALPSTMLQLTDLSRLRLFSLRGLALAACLVILYGALRAARDAPTRVFVLGNVLHMGITALSYVKLRWMYPAIPILVLSASWYGVKGCERGLLRRAPSLVRRLATPFLLILLSNGITSWISVVSRVARDVPRGEVRILEQRELTSMKASFQQWHPLIQGCRGILVLENTFTGAFANVPLDSIYDVWEIPPFGRLGDSAYHGLRPDRIDCVLVSEPLATEVGGGTNFQIRYVNYIRPYVQQLQGLGAVTYDLPRFGQVIILPGPVHG